jgi:membrane protein implicated in regulation of membrane protease activity
MTWADFYLTCFAVGFLLSAVSFIAGGMRWHLHLPHLPHFGGHGLGAHGSVGQGAVGHGSAGAGHASSGQSATANGQTVSNARTGQQPSVSPFNFVTLTAFLAWFGGTGFLISRFSGIWYALGLLIAAAAGIAGAGTVFLFLTRVLISHEENMDAADYEMVGVLGRISMPVRENGTGEIIYSQAGTRRTCGARSDDGRALEKGAEIMVSRYEKGIAYVKRWEEVRGE